MTKSISKTLIIGLGGTGQRVIRDIKKRLLRTYGEIPSLVKFLAFDTDEIEFEHAPFRYYYDGNIHEDFLYKIAPNEFYRIPYPRFDVLEHYPICSDKLDMEELRMLYGGGRLEHPAIGAYRVFGRACFLFSSREIIHVLSATIAELRAACLSVDTIASGCTISSDAITVYVIASLAGGTGSSAIMDMSRMLQIAGIDTYSNWHQRDCIYGMFFLPKFFEGKTDVRFARVNAFAALSELDYTLGLSDPLRYPEESTALEDDNNDYAGYPNNKRVVYDGVYLIGALTNNGHFYSLQEASMRAASFIADSIASDSYVFAHLFSVSAHRLHTVDGKYQNYSGLGYCEIRFNRRDFVRYLLNRKLMGLLEEYKSGENSFSAIQISEEFICKNYLNEGVRWDAEAEEDTRSYWNQLTDFIIDMNDRRLVGISMASINVGKEAAVNIETSKASYLNVIDTAAQKAVQDFAYRREILLQSLRSMLDERMTGKGFGMFPELARCLNTMLTEMKEGLEDELTQNEALFDRIEHYDLQQLIADIAENTSRGFWGIGSKRNEQEVAIGLYCDKVRFVEGSADNPTLAWLRVDSIRKKEAVAVYEEMIKIVDGYYKEETIETVNGMKMNVSGAYLAINEMFTALIDSLIRENYSYRPSKVATNGTVYADAYFKEYFEQHEEDLTGFDWEGGEAFENYISEQFSGFSKVNGEKLAEMRQTLLGLMPADGIIRQVQEERMSIDDLFIHCFGEFGDIIDYNDIKGNPQLELLSRLDTLLEPLWSYHYFNGEGLMPSENMLVGVYDSQNHIFSPSNGYQSAIMERGWCNFIRLGDPDRIAFMLMETAIPAHKLEGVEDWAKEFIQMRQYFYPFSDKRLEGIEMIMPDMPNR